MTRTELKQAAKLSLKGHWGRAVGGFFIVGLLSCVGQLVPRLGGILYIIIGGPVTLGMFYYALKISKNEEFEIGDVFYGFNQFGKGLGLYWLQVLLVFLWSLLLIIPGIIKGFAYSQAFFILAENPEIGASKALQQSEAMMNGYKMEYFMLYLSFIGWSILALFTFGIGFLWLTPYMMVTLANFYEEVKGNVTLSSDVSINQNI